MTKKLLSILLVLVMLAASVPMTALADVPLGVTFGSMDTFVYEGGIFDISVNVSEPNADKATYRWQMDASFGGTGSWHDLMDNKAWHGTKTAHLQLDTHEGVLYGTGWEDIPFRCLVNINGKEYASPAFTMQVMPKWMLIRDLEYAGEGFDKPNGVTVSGHKEIVSRYENGFPEKITAVAGQQLSFSINHSDPMLNNTSKFSDSEVSFVPEINIIKNLNPVQTGGKQCLFTPTAAGDTFVVEHLLYVKAGDIDHGIFQKNTMIVDIVAPESAGTATVKYDCSLLKDRYNESQKLIAIPKGREVQLVENSGNTWYKVLYYNTVGYLPADALNVQKSVSTSKKIDTVKVEMAEPTAELPAPYTAKIDGKGYTLHSIDWFDTDEERFLQQGEVFRDDRLYSASIWLSAENGYEFAVENNAPAVKGLLNGSPIDVYTAYEQDPHEVIELSVSFAPASHSCNPVLVPKVEPSCQQAGHEAYYLCECGKAYSDEKAFNLIDPKQSGVLPIAEHIPGDWSYNGTHHYRKCKVCRAVVPGTTAEHTGAVCRVCGFKEHVCATELVKMVDPTCERDGFEKYYKCMQCGKPYKDAGATQPVDLNKWGLIPKLPHSHGSWTYNTTSHASLCLYCNKTIAGTTAPHTGEICTVCGYVNPALVKTITDIEIDGVAEPVVGNRPDYNFVLGEGYAIAQNDTDYDWMTNGIGWYDLTDGKPVSPNQTFQSRHKYQVFISLKPQLGYQFGRIEPYVNGDNDTEFSGSNSKILVSYIFMPSGYEKITEIEIDNVAEPVVGNQPDYSFSVGSGYKINKNAQDVEYMHNGIAWYDMTDEKFVSFRHNFLPRHRYAVYVSLIPDEGYEFGNIDAYVNGDDDTEFAGSNAKMLVSYAFMPCGYEKITDIEIDDVAIPKVGAAPDYTVSVGENYSVNKNAQDVEWMHNGIGWYDVTDGKFVSLRHTFLEGHQYEVYISLIPDDGYEFGNVDTYVNGDDADFAGSNAKMLVSYTFPPCPTRTSTGTRPYRG